MSAEAATASATVTLGEAIAARIDAEGPMTLHDYMALANAAYYAGRDPLGSGGDFITAPEISQMFGEMIGLWCADLWTRAGRPADVAYVELGPGRGTLAADALRAMRQAGLEPPVHFVETSPVLRTAQAKAVPGATFHDDVAGLPESPLLIVANEFFDALPIRQLVRSDTGWRERVLANDRAEQGSRFLPALADAPVEVPDAFAEAPQGSVVERCPVGEAIMATLAARIAGQGGAMLAIDYGHEGPAVGDTFQAVQAHRFADPFVDPGARDLTAHVDFTALADMALEAGCNVSPVVGQGDFLIRLGIGTRSAALARARPERQRDLVTARTRLTDPSEMGRLFKAMAVVHPDWPVPEGFAG